MAETLGLMDLTKDKGSCTKGGVGSHGLEIKTVVDWKLEA
jgi:hypothetical protein